MPSTRQAPSLDGVRVLIVDDAKLDAKLCRILLEQEGCQVRIAAQARDAVALVASLQPSLILVDIHLAGAGGGFALTRSLKAARETQGVVIIAMTAYNGEEAALAAGCDGFITKPIDVDKFSKTIRAILNGGES